MLLPYKAMIKDDKSEWVVFLHGIGGGSSIWCKQIRDFRKHFNLLLIDLPGHCGAEYGLKDMKEVSFRAVAQEILTVVNHLSIPKAHFVGISLGTIIIQVIYELEPKKVSSMVLGGAVECFDGLGKALIHIAQPIKRFVPYMWLYRLSAWVLMPLKNHKESRKAFVKEAYKLGKEEFLHWFTLHKEVEPFFKNKRTKKEPVSTLYVMGDQDHMFLPAIKEKVKNTSNTFLKIVEKSGHVVNIDRSNEFNQLSIQFLLSLSTPPKQPLNNPKILV